MADTKLRFPKLNGTNWSTWKVRIENLLQREDLWDVVENSSKPKETSDDDWKTNNRHAKANIILAIEDNQLPLVKNQETAHDVFNALKKYHEKNTRSVKVSLLKKLCALNLDEHGDTEQHLFKIDELFDRLSAAGLSLDEDTKICMIFRSLPTSYETLVTALDCLSDDDISVELVRSKIVDESQRRIERDSSSTTQRNEKAHVSAENNRQRTPRLCHFCKKPGHLVANCKKKQKENKYNGNAKTVLSTVLGTAFVVNGGSSNAWIIDSGASAHMCHDKAIFTELKEFAGGFITLANGEKTRVLGEGSAVITVLDGSQKERRITFSDLKYVPGLEANLISVDRLAKRKMKVIFDYEGCKVIDVQGTIVATGVRYNGQYYLRLTESSMRAAHAQHLENCQHQWHRRLGHRDWAAVEKINKEKLGTGMKITDCGLKLVCECCLQGKSTRAPFPTVIDRKSTRVLDLVHTDVCGPMETPTPSGYRYVLHIVDDFSRFTVTCLMQKKSEAAEKIMHYVQWVENIFGRKPRFIRSDGGGEFDNTQLRKFYTDNGIKPQFTTPYSPQSNGVAERKNRSITEMTTCMLMDSGMDKRFWGEATLTATYLQNRLPSRSVSKTPYELWWNRKPDLRHLRIFGSDAYVHIPKVKRNKLDERAVKLKLVGYSHEHKAYRFVNPETDCITISRDARFVENEIGTNFVEVPMTETLRKKADNEKNVTTDSSTVIEPSQKGNEHTEMEINTEENGRPERRSKLPTYLEDYVLGYAAGVASCAREEPLNVQEAMKEKEWREAMSSEMESHRSIGTWELVPLPKGRKAIGSRWVFKIKRNEKDKVVKYKARVVAQGYTQRYGIDYCDVYAPVTNYTTFRTFLTIAGKQKLTVQHLDVKTAYLNGVLEEEIYMRQPPGFAVQGQEELVCRLKRSIYGLHQSARCWYRKLSEVLAKLAFKASTADQCLYVKSANGRSLFLLVYVDDMLIATSTQAEARQICDDLNQEFSITCLGEIKHFLGMEAQQSGGFYKIRLKTFIERLLETHGMNDAKCANSPMDQGYLKQPSEAQLFEDVTKYRSLVGGLLYLAVTARPDVAAATAILGRKFTSPTQADWTAAKRVLRYLKRTKEYFLPLGGTDEALCGYSDSDWAGDIESRRSTSGFIFLYCGGVVSWASRRQTCVTLSSMEAEYVALTQACQETIWLRKLLRDFGEGPKDATVIKEDNQGCLAFVKNERTHRRSKHIDTKEHFVQELCERNEIILEYCPTEVMIADIMTKPLGPQKHEFFCDLLNMK